MVHLEMEYYSPIKRNDLSSHEKTWRKLKCVLLSKRSKSEKFIYCMIPNVQHPGKGKTVETVPWPVFAKGGMGENRESTEDF